MGRYYSYLNTAKEILRQYRGEEPFASFIKKFFARHKKIGSRDRREISHLCYCYFRLGRAALQLPTEERIIAGLFFCSNESNEILYALRPDWNDKIRLRPEEKCSIVPTGNQVLNALPIQSGSIFNVFPWKEELSEGIEHEKFAASFFIQPDLFLRLRPGKENMVKQKLQKAGIQFKEIKNDCIALFNTSKLDGVIELNTEAVVQDYSSQRVGEFFGHTGTVRPGGQTRRPDGGGQTQTVRPGAKVWDCCAASGGKSIMAKDILGDIDLTVSDIRESILANLKKRFAKAGINEYKYFVSDLKKKSSKALPLESGEGFNLIICDAPCTGSGAWSRTPEQLYYFEKKQIENFSFLQKQIVSNAIARLQPEGYFLYITCSVFKKENEELVDFIKENFHLNLIKMETLKGYDKKADTMFVALLRKPVQFR